MGSASKGLSVCLRIGELVCGVIVLAVLGRFLALVGEAGAYADERIIYSTVVASIAIALSILLMPPFTYTFMAFPIDFIMFALWLVAFCLLETLTGINTCNSPWYWSYWGFLWGGFWRRPTIVVTGPGDIDWAGCASWRTVLAFTFISSMVFLCSSFLGAYVVMKYREEKRYCARNLSRPPAAKNGLGPHDGPHDGPQDGHSSRY